MDEEYFWGRGFYCKKRINCLHNDILVLFIFYIIKLVRKKDCICIEDYHFEMRRVICHSCCKTILIISLRRWIIDSGLTIIVEICFILFENLKKHGIFKK